MSLCSIISSFSSDVSSGTFKKVETEKNGSPPNAVDSMVSLAFTRWTKADEKHLWKPQ